MSITQSKLAANFRANQEAVVMPAGNEVLAGATTAQQVCAWHKCYYAVITNDTNHGKITTIILGVQKRDPYMIYLNIGGTDHSRHMLQFPDYARVMLGYKTAARFIGILRETLAPRETASGFYQGFYRWPAGQL